MSAQNPTPSGGPTVDGPHDPEHDPTASYALEPDDVGPADAPDAGHLGHHGRGPVAAQRRPAGARPAVDRRGRRRGVRPGPPGAGRLGADPAGGALRDPAAAPRPRARPPGRDHRPDRLGVRQGPQARLRRAAAHRAHRPLLRPHRPPAPRHPAQARRRAGAHPGRAEPRSPRASSASSRRGTTRSRWPCATACPRCSPATRWSPSPTRRRCSPRCSAAELLEQAGFPRDLWQVVAGPGSRVGTSIIERADYVCFTGSTATGKIVAKGCADRLIGCSLELGGKNPMLVLRDADLEKAAEGAVRASFSNAGQLCVSTERMFVADQVYDRFVERFVARTAGDDARRHAGLGQRHGLADLAGAARHGRGPRRRRGRQGRAGADRRQARPDLGPFFYEPTILEGVTPEMTCFGNETFGPVISLYRFHDEADAVARANAGEYGLNASIYSQDGRRARAIAREIKCGTVNINEAFGATFASIDSPMGGMRESGMGRRQGSRGDPALHRVAVGRDPAAGPLRTDARHVRRDLREGDDRQPAPDEEAGTSMSRVRLRRPGRRVRLRWLGHRAAPDREGLPGRRARGGRAVRRPGLRRHLLGRASATCSGPRSAATASSASTRVRDCLIVVRRGGRRRLAGLRQHALRAAAGVLHRPAVGPHHATGSPSSRRTTTRPSGCSAWSQNPLRTPADEVMEQVAERDGRRRHLPPHPGGRLLRRSRRRAGPDGGRPVLRRCRARPVGVHRLRRVHDRLPPQRQEHPGQELPLPRRAERRPGPAAHDGHPGRAPHHGGGYDVHVRFTKAKTGRTSARRVLHRRAGRPGRVLAGHPAAAAPDARRGAPPRTSRRGSGTSRAPTPSRSSAPSRRTRRSTTARASRSPRASTPTSTPTSSRCATARAATSCR